MAVFVPNIGLPYRKIEVFLIKAYVCKINIQLKNKYYEGAIEVTIPLSMLVFPWSAMYSSTRYFWNLGSPTSRSEEIKKTYYHSVSVY